MERQWLAHGGEMWIVMWWQCLLISALIHLSSQVSCVQTFQSWVESLSACLVYNGNTAPSTHLALGCTFGGPMATTNMVQENWLIDSHSRVGMSFSTNLATQEPSNLKKPSPGTCRHDCIAFAFAWIDEPNNKMAFRCNSRKEGCEGYERNVQRLHISATPT